MRGPGRELEYPELEGSPSPTPEAAGYETAWKGKGQQALTAQTLL